LIIFEGALSSRPKRTDTIIPEPKSNASEKYKKKDIFFVGDGITTIYGGHQLTGVLVEMGRAIDPN
jgi:hypothetical protein